MDAAEEPPSFAACFLQGFSAADGNPFWNQDKDIPRRESIKRAIACFTLVPIRLLCIVVILLFAVIIAKIATIGLPSEQFDPLHGRPLSGWRYALFSVVLYGRWLLLWSFGFIGVRVTGQPATQAEAPILVANHVSGLIEGMFLLRCGITAEASYLTNPVLGPIMKATSGIFVSRRDPDSRTKTKQAMVKRAKEPEAGWPQTLVFPEGTCTNGNALVQFKQGPFAAGCPVQPVCFRYPNRHHDVSFTFPESTLSYVFGMLKQCVNYMEVHYMEVITPTEEEKQNPAMFAAGVQRKMAEWLEVPTTNHAAEDVALCLHAQRMKLPLEAGLVQWQKIQENLTGLRTEDARKILEQFKKLDRDGTGRIDVNGFKEAMRTLQKDQPLTDQDLDKIFHLLDVSGDGFVDFQEYMCGVAVLNGHGNDRVRALKWTWDVLAHGEESITKEQLESIMLRTFPTITQVQLGPMLLEVTRHDRVSRQEFIDFALKHAQDFRPCNLILQGLRPSEMRTFRSPV